MEKKMTFDEIYDLEPAIRKAYNQAKMIGRKTVSSVLCANTVWYTCLKPIVAHTIGYNRKPSKPDPNIWDNPLPLERLESMAVGPEDIRGSNLPVIMFLTSESEDSRLKTSDAYALAYDKIYEALLDCRQCGCF